ncbi:RNA polymerase sigma factor sigC-like isoform X2 [Abrus precatorius]|uniref:RNA polymerase sigma factor sigC-like isoform X2 n=1 Tax=Abrus precatorius TaxID=3816 RepID=A0A8B8MKT7_ABRPR|nr:RNA polymerase sigma factor sigC-like isoform X2 [Abrus precatorius]
MGFGFGFSLNPRLRYNLPLHSPHSFTTSSAGVRLSLPSTIFEEGETLLKDFGRVFAFSASGLETLQHDSLGREETKVNKGKRSLSSVHEMIDNSQMRFGEVSTISTKFQSFRDTHFRLLMENLGVLEETFADSEALRLEKDIILQLEKLGALELFNFCLSKSLGTSLVSDYTDGLAEQVEENERNCKVDDYKGKVFVQSSRKKETKTKKRAFVPTAVSSQSLPLKASQEDLSRFSASFVKTASNTKNKRIMVAKREAEMSKGVKVLAELEKIKIAIEEDTKRAASLNSWAEASGVDEKVLQQLLHHGHYCQDELIRSTRTLVLYLARKYRGMGIALDDLLQAGYVGVLQGAERFDSTRGYKFSTYVQYWIRKSISRMVALYARGIVIPWSLNRAINEIQKARKSMKSTSMKCPDDYQIAKMTGLSLDKIRSASNCLRIVASIDQKVGDCISVEYMELIADTLIENPEEVVMKQHMKKDVHDLLKGLNSRERQILMLRFGLNDNQPRSLQDTGKVFKVSKERIRKIEKKALTKLRNEATNSKLNYYLDP